jgi:hypothetical protein
MRDCGERASGARRKGGESCESGRLDNRHYHRAHFFDEKELAETRSDNARLSDDRHRPFQLSLSGKVERKRLRVCCSLHSS